MPVLVCDRQSYKITSREYTDEGFLRVPGRVARTGIQEYLARELQLDGDPMSIVRVYRPADEVFDEQSLASYDGADVTVNHPSGLVTADNFRDVSSGVVRGSGRKDGDFVQCDLIVKDKSAIEAINSGKCELSVGYTAEYDPTPGVTEDGLEYDFIQRGIRVNHVALVDRARAGANARVFDHKPQGGIMPVFITTDSGRQVDVADTANAQVVADAFDRLQKTVADAKAQAEQAQAVADSAKEKLAAAEAASAPEALHARVVAIATKQSMARKIAGDSFTCESVDTLEIMRSALTLKRPNVAWADKSEAYVQAAFDMAAEEAEDEDKEDKDKSEQLKKLAKDAARETVTDAKPSAYDAYKNQFAGAK